MLNTTLNIAQADILSKFHTTASKDINIDLFYDDNQIMVDFPLNDEFDLVIYLNSDVSTPDDYSILCEGTKYNKAVYASQYDSDLDKECNIDLSFILKHIENFIVSGDYKSKEEVFFDEGDLESSWVADKEYNSPMNTYGLSNSDLI